MPWWLALINTIMGAGAAGFAVAAVIRPRLLAPSDSANRDDRFYPAMYAARSAPLGALVVVAVWLAPSPLTPLILGAAALAQVGDAAIGLSYRIPGMESDPPSPPHVTSPESSPCPDRAEHRRPL